VSEKMQDVDAEVERYLSMSEDEIAADLKARGITERDVELSHFKALAGGALKANVRLHERCDKFRDQVRDTCVRAEKAEASVATLTALVAELTGALEFSRDKLPGLILQVKDAPIGDGLGRANEALSAGWDVIKTALTHASTLSPDPMYAAAGKMKEFIQTVKRVTDDTHKVHATAVEILNERATEILRAANGESK